jgi:hypothetical protein
MPYWPSGIRVVNSIFGGWCCEGPVKTSCRNAYIFSFWFSLPLASNLLGPMLLLQEGEKENAGNKIREENGKKTSFTYLCGKKITGKKTTFSNGQVYRNFKLPVTAGDSRFKAAALLFCLSRQYA